MNRLILILLLLLNSCESASSQKREDIKRLQGIVSLFEEGEIEKSLSQIRRYLIVYPRSSVGHNLLASIYLSLNKDSLALLSVRESLSLDSANYGALTNYGIILGNLKRHDDAYPYLIKATMIKSDYPQAYSNLMGNRIAKGDIQSARFFGEKALLYWNRPSDIALLCAIYHKLGENVKRDSLRSILVEMKYENLQDLQEILDN